MISKNSYSKRNSVNSTIHNNLIDFVNSVTPSVRFEDNENNVKTKSHYRAKSLNANYGMHTIRSDQTINQIFKYPKFMNLPMLKIIDKELNFELELRDDVDADQQYNRNKSTVI